MKEQSLPSAVEPKPMRTRIVWRGVSAIFRVLSALVSACGNGPGTPRLSERRSRRRPCCRALQDGGREIHKTVENVEGVYLLKIRPRGINYGDQFKLDDPYGSDLGGLGMFKPLCVVAIRRRHLVLHRRAHRHGLAISMLKA